MLKDQLKSIMRKFSEVLITLALVSSFFLLLLFLLGIFFPSGVRVNQMIAQTSTSVSGKEGAGFGAKKLISFGVNEDPLKASKSFSAILANKRNITKSKRANGVAWVDAPEGMKLYNRDAIQTSANSSASIVFDEGHYIQMGENSLLIIRQLEEDVLAYEKHSQLLIIDGEINGKILGSEKESVFMEVSLPNGVARMQSQGLKGDHTEFKITVNPDKSSTISVYRGLAEITAQGKTVKVRKNQSTKINLFGFPTKPVFLPEIPRLLLPDIEKTYYFRGLSPRIQFSWVSLNGISNYHFVLAHDPSFEDILVDEKISSPYFDHYNLKNGRYFWRVSSVGETGESAFSQTGKFQVVHDVEPPSLRVEFPPAIFDQGDFLLTGVTDQEAKVFVDKEEVPINPKGEFFHKLNFQTGPNIIVVEAWDKAGNVNYRSKVVHAKIQ